MPAQVGESRPTWTRERKKGTASLRSAAMYGALARPTPGGFAARFASPPRDTHRGHQSVYTHHTGQLLTATNARNQQRETLVDIAAG